MIKKVYYIIIALLIIYFLFLYNKDKKTKNNSEEIKRNRIVVEFTGTKIADFFPREVKQILQARIFLENRQFEELLNYFEKLKELNREEKKDKFLVNRELEKKISIIFSVNIPEYEQLLNEFIKKYPSLYLAYLARAEYYHHMGWESRGYDWAYKTSFSKFRDMDSYFKKAKKDIKRTLELKPNQIQPYQILITISRTKGKISQAREYLEKALQILPQDFEIRRYYMYCLEPRWGGSYKMMEDFAEECYQFNPELKVLKGFIPYDQGRMLVFDKKYNKALLKFNKAISYGEFVWFYYMRARLYYFKLKDNQKALQDINKAIQLAPPRWENYLLRARILFILENYTDALKNINIANMLSPLNKKINKWRIWSSQKALRDSYDRFYVKKQYDKALNLCKISLELNPKNAETYCWIGYTYLAKGDKTQAKNAFEKALEIKPDYKEASRNLAKLKNAKK